MNLPSLLVLDTREPERLVFICSWCGRYRCEVADGFVSACCHEPLCNSLGGWITVELMLSWVK